MKSTDNSFEQKPDTYKSPGSDTYIVFGEAKIEDLSQQVIIHLDPFLEISLDQNLDYNTYIWHLARWRISLSQEERNDNKLD